MASHQIDIRHHIYGLDDLSALLLHAKLLNIGPAPPGGGKLMNRASMSL